MGLEVPPFPIHHAQPALVVVVMNLTHNKVMNQVNLADAKAHFSHYIERVEKGDTIILCRRNVPVAEIRPLKAKRQEPRRVGIDRGMQIPQSFFDPLPEELLDEFEGGARGGASTRSRRRLTASG